MNIGYNDMNTFAPQPFITPGPIVISGGARPKKISIEDLKKMERQPIYTLPYIPDGEPSLDIKEKKKRIERDPHWRRAFGGGRQDDVEKAMKQLKSFMDGKRKTKPAKKMLDILEREGIISKVEEMSGGINRLKKANRWRDFSNDTARIGIDTGRYGYEQYKEAMNPVQAEAKKAFGNLFGGEMNGGVNRLKKGTRWRDFANDTARMGIDTGRYGYEQYRDAMNPVQAEAKKAIGNLFGGEKPKKSPSQWVMFVKDFAQQNNIPYKEALKAASPHYKKLKGSGYSRVN